MSVSTTSVAHQPGRMADLLATTHPLPTVPRGRHRAVRRVDVQLHLLTLALGALSAAALFITLGGPW